MMIFLLFLSMFFLPLQERAYGLHFKEPTPTPVMVDFIGKITINGYKAALGDEIGVTDQYGLLVGRTTITTPGQYGVLHVYGDDPTTPQHDGADPGSVLIFKLWQASSRTETVITQAMMSSSQPLGGFKPSGFPLRWTEDKDKYVVDLAVKVDAVPLFSGWGSIIILTLLLFALPYKKLKKLIDA